MILNVQSTYVTNARPRIEPYLYVCHAGSDDGHWGRRHDRHLLYNWGRNCSSWHICRRLSRPIVRHMLWHSRHSRLPFLSRHSSLPFPSRHSMVCLWGDGRLLCLLLRSVTTDLSIGCINGLTIRVSICLTSFL